MNLSSHLFILQSSPYAQHRAKEGLDFALAWSAMASVGILFREDAVYHFLPEQSHAAPLMFKNRKIALQALELYDVHHLYIQQSALRERGIDPHHLCHRVCLLEDDDIPELFARYQHLSAF